MAAPWRLGSPLKIDDVIVVHFDQRGGMERTVSTTLRWDQGSGSTDSSPPQSRYGDRAMSSRSRSRRSHRRRLRAEQASPPSFWSSVLPRDPPAAQPELIERPVRDNWARVGTVRAIPQAPVDEIIRDMANELNLAHVPEAVPREATLWEDITELVMQPQPPLRRPVVVDLREDAWEFYQYPRMMPLIEGGHD